MTDIILGSSLDALGRTGSARLIWRIVDRRQGGASRWRCWEAAAAAASAHRHPLQVPQPVARLQPLDHLLSVAVVLDLVVIGVLEHLALLVTQQHRVLTSRPHSETGFCVTETQKERLRETTWGSSPSGKHESSFSDFCEHPISVFVTDCWSFLEKCRTNLLQKWFRACKGLAEFCLVVF